MAKGALFLIHWNQAEAEEYAEKLRGWGWQVALEAEDGALAVKEIKANLPDAIVIYHTRLPSHGRHTAAHLAETRATSAIPVIFVGGEGLALDKTKEALPNAAFISEDQLAKALEQYAQDDG